jgi:uncharacterized lipoprotein
MKSVRAILWLAPLLLALGACHSMRGFNSCHARQAYMNEKTLPPLKIPPGLDTPDTTRALRLPALNEPAPPARKGRDPCLDEPPSFKVRQASAPPRT